MEEGDSWNRDLLVPCPMCARPIIVDYVKLKSPSRDDDDMFGDLEYVTEQLGCKCRPEKELVADQRLMVYIQLLLAKRIQKAYPSAFRVDDWTNFLPDVVDPKDVDLEKL